MTGAERLRVRFEETLAGGSKGLMPFIVGGHPGLVDTPAVLAALDAAGATAIEIGLPFSDPIADGPVIASAMHRVLENGTSIGDVIASVSDVSGSLSAPLIAMVSVSVAWRFGPDRFAAMLADAGIAGAIFPDAPLEEAAPLSAAAESAGITSSLLISPTTPEARASEIARASTGFVYMIARAGITGTQEADPSSAIAGRVSAIRRATDLPIACGFGISNARHVNLVTQHADAAIVGSALVDSMSEAVASEIGRAHV